MRGVPRLRRAISCAPGGFDLDVQQIGGAEDDFLQVVGDVIIQPFADAEAGEQRRAQQSAARGRADEREARQIQPHAARVRSLVNDDVELEILHRRIEIFLNGFLETVNLVNEQHIAFLKVGEQTGEVAGFFNGRAAGGLEVGTHGFGENVGDGGFAEAGRPVEQDMVERLAALLGGGDGDLQPLLHLRLAGEIGKEGGAQRHFKRRIGFVQSGNRSFGHRVKDCGTPRAAASAIRLDGLTRCNWNPVQGNFQ